jgi:hypothetical protein
MFLQRKSCETSSEVVLYFGRKVVYFELKRYLLVILPAFFKRMNANVTGVCRHLSHRAYIPRIGRH